MEVVQVEGSVLEHILTTLRSLDECIRGNGKPGLRQDLRDLRLDLTACQKRRDELAAQQERLAADRDKWWSRFVQPGVVLVYGGVAFLLALGFMTYLNRLSHAEMRQVIQSVVVEEFGGRGAQK